MKIEGVILAGGKSSRMNYSNKSFLSYGGSSFISIIIETFKKKFEKISIVANDFSKYVAFDVEIYGDYYKGIGPIAGIHSAIKSSDSDLFFFVGTDMPFFDIEAIEMIMKYKNDADVIIAEDKNGLHPLFGIYNRKILGKIEEEIARGNYKLVDLINNCNYKTVDFTSYEDRLKNINTVDEYNCLE